jgi:hypothetical protein
MMPATAPRRASAGLALRLFILFVALFAALGGFIADFSDTHALKRFKAGIWGRG